MQLDQVSPSEGVSVYEVLHAGHFYRNPQAVDSRALPAYPADVGRNCLKKSLYYIPS